MGRPYRILVEFTSSVDGHKPVTQILNVYSTGPDFNVLLECLDASPAVAKLQVQAETASPNGWTCSNMNQCDLGLVLNKLK
jgi:hypothetical protein